MKTYSINLNEEQLKTIDAVLANGPYRIVAPVIEHINHEIQKQTNTDSNTYNIYFNEEHLKVIDLALANGVYGVVAPVIAHINVEIQKQLEFME
jgi:LPS sulfotransferase NodH